MTWLASESSTLILTGLGHRPSLKEQGNLPQGLARRKTLPKVKFRKAGKNCKCLGQDVRHMHWDMDSCWF